MLRTIGTVVLAALALLASACGEGGSSPRSQAAVKVGSSAETFQEQLVRDVRAVSPSVVQIATGSGLGSGVVYDGHGNIVTNAHVVGNATKFSVTLPSGNHPGTLVGSFPPDDLAVVHVEGVTPPPASFADSSKIEVGDVALAIGNPLGLRSSVTEGIVSSLGRTVSEGNGVVLASAIQTSAAINPGNSGGALVNLAGQVIGIPTLTALDPELGGAQAPGIGFAIPSNTVRRIADQLIEKGSVERSGRAFLGVRVSSIVGGGVLVAGVTPGGPAAKAGIKPGEIIVAVDGKPTSTADVLVAVLAGLKPGQRVSVKILQRNGKVRTVIVTLGDLHGSG
ncbi:MAG TPA: trypsin-like peptidase domain-containing protein [Gaiellaceae bacterium]|jgi:S1-C subfamily serine protease|nr:trypsin-like peptidase domain-containing protein [Gaiellaceae bacterium]